MLVTGGTRGIGRAVAQRFTDAGAELAVCGRNEPDDAVGTFVACDVRDAEQVTRLFDEVTSRFGRLDVLVNNAGGSPSAPAASASPRFVSAIVGLNLVAPFLCAQAANAVMQEQAEGGCIVNIGSVSGLRPSPGTALYGAAKAGLINLTATLAVEWAPKVRVNCVSAGLVRTPDSLDHYGGPEGVAAVAATVPLGRMGNPGEVADACAYLASPGAAYVSGANLVVHGGGERPAFLGVVEQGGP